MELNVILSVGIAIMLAAFIIVAVCNAGEDEYSYEDAMELELIKKEYELIESQRRLGMITDYEYKEAITDLVRRLDEMEERYGDED